MDDRPSFAERRARAAELRKGDYDALKEGRPPAILMASLGFLILTACVILFAVLAALDVWFFGWTLWLVVTAVWLVVFAALVVVVKRTTPTEGPS